jgi:hypothetical protein
MTLKWTIDTEDKCFDNVKIAVGMQNNAYDGKLFELITCGGFITVKHYFLNVYHTSYRQPNSSPFLHFVFWDLKSCREFADKLDAGEPVVITSMMLTPAYE